jgi:hypothetical protein
MRITGKQLRRIIQEEVARMVNEDTPGMPSMPVGTVTPAPLTMSNGGVAYADENIGKTPVNVPSAEAPASAALLARLKRNSDITGVAQYYGAGLIDVAWNTSPINGELIWRVGENGQRVYATSVRLATPVRDTIGKEIGGFNIQSSGGSTSMYETDPPATWYPKNTDYTRRGIVLDPADGAKPKQMLRVPVKVQLKIEMATTKDPGLKNTHVVYYTVTPA